MIPISLDLIFHLDGYLALLASEYGLLIYGILFLIILLETGIVIFPFLPGDSLLFVAGTLSAIGALNIVWLFILLTAAAIIGDSINYTIGRKIGSLAFEGKIKWLNKQYLDRTETFYEKHGKKTIILARFIPIIRTFAPFVAGIGKMEYSTFLSYNIIGSILWVSIFLFSGYFLGNIPIVKENLAIILLAIIIISIAVGIKEILKK